MDAPRTHLNWIFVVEAVPEERTSPPLSQVPQEVLMSTPLRACRIKTEATYSPKSPSAQKVLGIEGGCS